MLLAEQLMHYNLVKFSINLLLGRILYKKYLNQDLISKILDLDDLKFINLPRRVSDQDCFIASIEKVKNSLNWEPRINSEIGIKKMINWTTQLLNNHKKNKY